MTDLESRKAHNANSKKRNFSIESILQADRLKLPFKSTLGGHLLDNLKDEADASSKQVSPIINNSTRSDLHVEGAAESNESSSLTANFRRQSSPSSSDNFSSYMVPGLPLPMPLVDQAHVEHFDWINCTRYNPPRIPKELSATNLSGCSPNDLPKKRKYLSRSPRIPFNSAQLSVLEERFRQAPYLSGAEVQRLANELEMSDVRVKIWFQNRRAREKRERLAKAAPQPNNRTTMEKSMAHSMASLATDTASAERISSDSAEGVTDHVRHVDMQLLQRNGIHPPDTHKCPT